MLIENQRVYLDDMLSGWYRDTSPCPATASVGHNTQLCPPHHICWCRLQPAVHGSCKVQDGASLVCMYTSDESLFRVLLPPSLSRVAASVALHILFALLVVLEITQSSAGVHYAHR